jgi:hypothetical protein
MKHCKETTYAIREMSFLMDISRTRLRKSLWNHGLHGFHGPGPALGAGFEPQITPITLIS